MTTEEKTTVELPSLTSKQKQFLKGLAHPMNALIQIGKGGISEGLIEMTSKELQFRELVKVKIIGTCDLEKNEAATLLAQKTKSHLVQLIGKTIVLYRENPKRNKEERIRLPKG